MEQLAGSSRLPSNPFLGVDPAVQQFMQIMYSENEKLIGQLRQKHAEIRQLKQAHTVALQEKNQELEDLKVLVGQLLGNGTAALGAARGSPAGQSMSAGEHFSTEILHDAAAAAANPGVALDNQHTQPALLASGDAQEARAAVHNPAAATAPAQDARMHTVVAGMAMPASELQHADALAAVRPAGTKRPRSVSVKEDNQADDGVVRSAAAPDSSPQIKRANTSIDISTDDDTAAPTGAAAQALAAANVAAAASNRAAAKGFRPLPPGTFTLSPCNRPAQQPAVEELQQRRAPATPAAQAQASDTPSQMLTNMLHRLQQAEAAATAAEAVAQADRQLAAGSSIEDQDAADMLQLLAATGSQQHQQPAHTVEADVQAVAHKDAAPTLSLQDMVLTLKTFLHQHSGHDNNSAAVRGSSGGGANSSAAPTAAMPQFAAQPQAHAFHSLSAQRALDKQFEAAGLAPALAPQAAAPGFNSLQFAPGHITYGGNGPAPIADVPAVMQRLLGANLYASHKDDATKTQQASAAGAAAAVDAYAASAFGYNDPWQTNWQAFGQQEGLAGSHGMAAAAAAAGVADTDSRRRSLSSFAGAGRRSSKGTKAEDGDVDGVFGTSAESHWRREIERQVPAIVQQAILADWEAKPEPRELPVVCNGHEAIFYVDPISKECMVRTSTGQQLKPTQFERQCDEGQAKDWQRSIRVPGYEGKNGWIRMGHFVRIAGISTNRKTLGAGML